MNVSGPDENGLYWLRYMDGDKGEVFVQIEKSFAERVSNAIERDPNDLIG